MYNMFCVDCACLSFLCLIGLETTINESACLIRAEGGKEKEASRKRTRTMIARRRGESLGECFDTAC